MLQTTTGFRGAFAALPGLDGGFDIRLSAHVDFSVVNDLRGMLLGQDNDAVLIPENQVSGADFHVSPDAWERHRPLHRGVLPLAVRVDRRRIAAPDRNWAVRQRVPVPDAAIQQEAARSCPHHAGHHIVANDRPFAAIAGRDHDDSAGSNECIEIEGRQARLHHTFPALGAQGKAGHPGTAERSQGRRKNLRLQPHRDHDVRRRRGFKIRKPRQQCLIRHCQSSLQKCGKLDTPSLVIYHLYINNPALPMALEAARHPGTDGERTIKTVPAPICDALRGLGLEGAEGPLSGEPLSGGVSCDIWRVDLPDGPVCAKRALAKLKVAEDWYAPTSRINYEAAYYRFAATIEPGATPGVLGHDAALGVLVTEFLSPSTHTVWKEELKDGIVRSGHVRTLAGMLRHLHDASRNAPQVPETFDQPELIHALRLSPYFLASIPANPDLETELQALVHLFERNSLWLIHGDFSPKNILFGPDSPVILDAECANLGDAAFDLAFCGAHLFLKAAWKPHFASRFAEAFADFRASYFAAGEDPDLEARAARYLAGFLIARMDGKSPVEYITAPADKARIRTFAREHLKQPAASLLMLADAWFPDWASQPDTRKTEN